MTQKRIKCTNAHCNHNYHAECVKYSDSSSIRTTWICPLCTASRPREVDNKNSPILATDNTGKIMTPPDCTSSSNSKLDITAILNEIRNLRLEMNNKFDSQKDSLKEFHTTLNTVKQEIREMGSKLSNMREEFDDITKSVNFLAEYHHDQTQLNEKQGASISKLQSDNIMLNTQLSILKQKINVMEQHARDCNLEIQCVPEYKNENLQTIIQQLIKTVQSEVPDSHVINFHRVAKMNPESKRPRSIVVKFSTPRSRDSVLAAVKNFNKTHDADRLNSSHLGFGGDKQQIFVQEHLSAENKKLHSITRKFAKDKNYQFVWIRSGRIFLRKDIKSPPLLVKDEAFLAGL